MLEILTALFVFIMLFIRLPVRIQLKSRNCKNRRLLGKIELFSLSACAIIFISMIICAGIEGKVDKELVIGCTIVFGGTLLMIVIPLIIASNSKEKTSHWEHIYALTNQRPDETDYGFSKKNPIWAGTCEEYMNHLVADNGEPFEWKYIKKMDVPRENNMSLNARGDCIMFKIGIVFKNGKEDVIYIVRKTGLDNMTTWHAPKGYKYL